MTAPLFRTPCPDMPRASLLTASGGPTMRKALGDFSRTDTQNHLEKKMFALTALLLLSMSPLAAQAATSTVHPVEDVANPQPISDEMLRQEYADYRKSVEGMKMYGVSYLLLPTEAEAQSQIARLRSGADFAKTARAHSKHAASAAEGGKLGTFATCRWARDTLVILDALKPGQIHPRPVKASAGWSVYRLDSVAPLVPVSFENYKAQLLSGRFKAECPWVPPVQVDVPGTRHP